MRWAATRLKLCNNGKLTKRKDTNAKITEHPYTVAEALS
jgi:hypothetical protein